jgi:predicted transcriptional regulator
MDVLAAKIIMTDQKEPAPLIEVASLDEVFARLKAAFRGIPSPKSHSFISQELADKVLTPSRRNIIEVLTNRGGLSLAEIATATGQTIESVRADVRALCLVGLLCQPDADHAAFS